MPISSDQPSTSTNSMILNGSEISDGDTIAMPIDISTLATTTSITRNGMNNFGQHALYIAMMVAAPLLLTALLVGLLVGIIQAATQIHEMTLSFIPKLLAMALVGLVVGPWMLRTLVQFTHDIIVGLPGAIK